MATASDSQRILCPWFNKQEIKHLHEWLMLFLMDAVGGLNIETFDTIQVTTPTYTVLPVPNQHLTLFITGEGTEVAIPLEETLEETPYNSIVVIVNMTDDGVTVSGLDETIDFIPGAAISVLNHGDTITLRRVSEDTWAWTITLGAPEG